MLAVRAESCAFLFFLPEHPKALCAKFTEEAVSGPKQLTSILKSADASEFCYEQLELEGLQRMSAKRKEQEQVRREATEDLAEDLSEAADTLGELVPVETAKKKFQRNFSDLTVWSDDNKEKKLYIVLIRS